MRGRVLVVDDDPTVGTVLGALLRQAGFGAHHLPSGAQALEHVEKLGTDVVITDVRMPGMDGMELLVRLRRAYPDLPVLLLTAHGTVPLAVEAMKLGATDFLLKPFDREEVVYCVEKALTAVDRASAPPPGPPTGDMIGASGAMGVVREHIARVAPTKATVLITGETGTGKEVAAREIHAQSDRAGGPFIAVQCAALPENLLESELFGHEKGAFTGAVARKPGRVEIAAGGTLLLDEMGELPLALQAKLLRLLQEKEYQPVGATRAKKADVRFLAATHRDLEAMVREGTFREDLYFRLNVVPLHLPPLRERRADIPLLAEHFWRRACEEHGRSVSLAEGGMAALEGLDWPGNVRELANAVERLVILSEGPTVDGPTVRATLGRGGALPASGASTGSTPDDLKERVRLAERDALLEALEKAQQKRVLAARLLGISRRTLYNKLEEHGLV